MSAPAVSLAELRAFMRQMHDSELDPVLTMARDAAQERVESFIGFSLDEFDADVPAAIRYCICLLAMVATDEIPADRVQQANIEVERALRPYRREPGVRAA